MTIVDPQWFKSSYSENGGQCIEVAANLIPTSDLVPVRDSKDPQGPTLAFGADAFAAFVQAVKAGEFTTT